MSKLVDFPSSFENRLTHGFMDDFDHLVSGDRWTNVLTDTGTAVVLDSAGGILEQKPSDGTVADNDEAYTHTTAEIFKFAADKAIIVEAHIQYTEANVDDANVMFGLMDSVAADALQDDGAGPKSSYSGAVLFKVDGGTNWQAESSVGSSQVTTDLTEANLNNLSKVTQTAGGAASQLLRIEGEPRTSTTFDIKFFIGALDNKPLVLVAKHLLTISSSTEMQVVMGVKNGFTNQETILYDYVAAFQVR